jgi:hypothetical protein
MFFVGRESSCPGRGAAFFMPLRRAGTVTNAGVRYGPGSAAHRKSAALRPGHVCVDYFATKPASFISDVLSLSSSSRNFSMSEPVRKIGFNACFSM